MKVVKVGSTQIKGYVPPLSRRARAKLNREAKQLALQERAAELTKYATQSEDLFCELLRKRGHEFEFQAVVGRFIADFLFPNKRKIIELDGRFHHSPKSKRRDAYRDRLLRQAGYSTLRLPSHLIFHNVDLLIELTENFLFDRPRKPRRPKPQKPAPPQDEAYQAFMDITEGL